jgi:dienelactone hydrolase
MNPTRRFEATVVTPPNLVGASRPCVLICHAWRGPMEFERSRADQLAALGYVACVVDMYGEGERAEDALRAHELMTPLVEDRAELRRRLGLALEMARGLEQVDVARIVACGYCFGGLCVLELARGGADVRGVVSFHGMLHTDVPARAGEVKAAVLVLHGQDDPLAPPEDVVALMTELSVAGVDWQLHAYGHTSHAFTNPAANMPESGMSYSAKADARSWRAALAFFDEVLADAST